MSSKDIPNDIPKIIVGSIKYPDFNRIPEDHPLRDKESLLYILKRTYEAGAEGCVFYLYNEELIQLLNEVRKLCPNLEFMLVIKYGKIDDTIDLLKKLEFKPLVVFLDHSIADLRDYDLVKKYEHALSKYTKNIGIYTLEAIGTTSYFITSTDTVNIMMMPFNMLGEGTQNRTMLEMIVNSSEKIFIATNPLASGKLNPKPAFEYVSTHKIHSVLIELEELEDMLQAIKFAKYYLETHDFLQITLEFEDIAPVCEQCGLGMVRYYPPSGGSYFYCPQCESTISADEIEVHIKKEDQKEINE